MKLTTGQATAEKMVHDWIANPSQQVFTLGGFAGTGKTTLLKHITDNLNPDDISFCAPTGKAAKVLSSKIEPEVTTIHRLLYEPQIVSEAELERLKLKLLVAENEDEPDLAQMIEIENDITAERNRIITRDTKFYARDDSVESKIIIIDEASMVGKDLLDDLIGTGAKLLFVGDPGQLPPVRSGDAWFLNGQQDYVLTEVTRQALDSPIIRLSMEVREGHIDRSQYKTGDCQIRPKSAVDQDEWMTADQVITGRNLSRQKANRFSRGKLGFDQLLPMEGERIICLRNRYESDGDDRELVAANGEFGIVTKSAWQDKSMSFLMDFELEDGFTTRDAWVYKYPFHRTYDARAKEYTYGERQGIWELDYAYAITAHKAQGSEWPFVILADDKMNRTNKRFRQQWLYTAITRAKEKMIWYG